MTKDEIIKAIGDYATKGVNCLLEIKGDNKTYFVRFANIPIELELEKFNNCVHYYEITDENEETINKIPADEIWDRRKPYIKIEIERIESVLFVCPQ